MHTRRMRRVAMFARSGFNESVSQQTLLPDHSRKVVDGGMGGRTLSGAPPIADHSKNGAAGLGGDQAGQDLPARPGV